MISRVAPVAGQVLLALAAVYGLLVGLGLLLTSGLEESALLDREEEVNEALAGGRTSLLNDLTYVLSGLGNTWAVIGALVVVAAALRLATKRWTLSGYLVLAVSGQVIVFLLVQVTIERPRPDVERLDVAPPTSSFPSGHTGAAIALFLGSALLVAWYVRRRWIKVVALTLLVSVPVLVAYARLYRGMHFPSDIVGSVVNGLSCVAIAARSVLGPARRGDPALDPPVAPARYLAGASSVGPA